MVEHQYLLYIGFHLNGAMFWWYVCTICFSYYLYIVWLHVAIASFGWTSSTYAWLHGNDLIDGMHKQLKTEYH